VKKAAKKSEKEGEEEEKVVIVHTLCIPDVKSAKWGMIGDKKVLFLFLVPFFI